MAAYSVICLHVKSLKSVADCFIFSAVDSVTALVRSYDKWLF